MDKIAKNEYRTRSCGDLRKEDIGTEVRLAGWVNTIRDHGGITFIDLRDHYGLVQLVMKEELAVKLSKETVISATGTVIARTEENVNSKLKTPKEHVILWAALGRVAKIQKRQAALI